MKLLVWDLVIGMHAALIWKTAEADLQDDQRQQFCAVDSEIDVAGGTDEDFRSYRFPEDFLDADAAVRYRSDADAQRELQESMGSKKDPLVCTVANRAEAMTVLATALCVRGGGTVNCDGMEVSVFGCIKALVESLDGDLDLITYTLHLFAPEPAAAAVTSPEVPALPPDVVNHSLADW